MAHFSQAIPSAAILEGAAFFVIVIYMVLDRSVWNLAIAAALAGLILLQFPTRAKIDAWVDHQMRQVADERALR